MDLNPEPTVKGVLDHLTSAFSTGEDESAIKSEFYSRKQLSRESEDDYAEVLQLLARKILIINPGFQAECNNALVYQFANGIRDDIIRPLAKDLASRKTRYTVCQIQGRSGQPKWFKTKKNHHKGIHQQYR